MSVLLTSEVAIGEVRGMSVEVALPTSVDTWKASWSLVIALCCLHKNGTCQAKAAQMLASRAWL